MIPKRICPGLLLLASLWGLAPAPYATDAGPGELVVQGNALFEAYDNIGALGFYERAYELMPENAELLVKLAWTCNNVGEDLNSGESEKYFERSVEYAVRLEKLAPDDAKTHFLLAMTRGNLALHRGGKEKVRLSRNLERDARRAIELDPDYAPPYAVLGVYYREVATLNWALKVFAKHLLGGLPDGTLKQSEEMFLRAIMKDPGSVYTHYQLARTYEEMNRRSKALTYYRKVGELPVKDHRDPHYRTLAAQRTSVLSK